MWRQQQMIIGALRAAEANLRRRIDLCREIKDEFSEAVGHQELGRLLAYRGVWAESEQELATALPCLRKTKRCSVAVNQLGLSRPARTAHGARF